MAHWGVEQFDGYSLGETQALTSDGHREIVSGFVMPD